MEDVEERFFDEAERESFIRVLSSFKFYKYDLIYHKSCEDIFECKILIIFVDKALLSGSIQNLSTCQLFLTSNRNFLKSTAGT